MIPSRASDAGIAPLEQITIHPVMPNVPEFRRDGRVVAAYLIASGRGHRGRSAIEATVESRRAQYKSRQTPPQGVLVGGTSDTWNTPITPPRDVVRGDASVADVVSGPTALPLLHISELRADPSRIKQVVP